MSLIRNLSDGHGGRQECLCLSDDPPITVRKVRGGVSFAAERPSPEHFEIVFTDFATETLQALVGDKAIPAELKAQLEDILAERGDDALPAKKRTASGINVDVDPGSAQSKTPIAASFGAGRFDDDDDVAATLRAAERQPGDALVRLAERRAKDFAAGRR